MSGPPLRARGSLRCMGLVYLPAGGIQRRGPQDGSPDAILEEQQALGQLLAAWAPGDRLCALTEPGGGPIGLLLEFSVPRRLGPQGALDRLLPAGVGASTLWPAGSPGPGELELALGGARRCLPRPAAALAPGALIDTGALARRSARPLGAPPPVPEAAPPAAMGGLQRELGLWSAEGAAAVAQAAAPPVGAAAARSRLGDWLSQVGGGVLQAILKAIRGPEPAPTAPAPGPALGATRGARWLRALGAGLGAALGAAVGAVGWLLQSTVGRAVRALKGALSRGAPPAPPPRPPAGPSAWSRIWASLSARLPLWRAMRWLASAQSEYLRGLVERFDRALSTSELLEALRHAIPLGGDGSAPPEGWFFGRFGQRELGTLTHGQRGAAAAVSAEVVGMLRRFYLDAHRRLDAEGDHARAAWVLAELLRDGRGAVVYLEEKGLLDEAARFAEATGQPTPELLRLWVQAGQPRRALELGLGRGALGAAILALEGAHPQVAALLRARWAEAQLEADDVMGATQTLWPLRAEPRVAETLRGLLAPIRADAELEAAWCVVASLALDPSAAPGVDPALRAALDRGPLHRLRLAEAALRLPPLRPAVAEPLIRALLPAAEAEPEARALLAGLRQATVEPSRSFRALDADLPALGPLPSAPGRPLDWSGPRLIPLPLGGPEAVRPLDALSLPHGGLVVALGGLGQRLLRPGAPPALISAPAERLLPAPGGWLALSAGGPGLLRVMRCREGAPPVSLGALPVGDRRAPLALSSPDGQLFVVEGAELCSYQPEAQGLRRLWRSGSLPEGRGAGAILAIDLQGDVLRAVVRTASGERELWRWERGAGPALRERRPLLPEPRLGRGPVVSVEGEALWELGEAGERLFLQGVERIPEPFPLGPARWREQLGLVAGLRAHAEKDDDGLAALVLRPAGPLAGHRPTGWLRIAGAPRFVRPGDRPDRLLVGDAHSRVLVIDLHAGALLSVIPVA